MLQLFYYFTLLFDFEFINKLLRKDNSDSVSVTSYFCLKILLKFKKKLSVS